MTISIGPHFDIRKLAGITRVTGVVVLGRFQGDPTYRALGTEGVTRPDGTKTHAVFLYEAGATFRKTQLTPTDGDYTSVDGGYDVGWGKFQISWVPHNQKTGSDEPIWYHTISEKIPE